MDLYSAISMACFVFFAASFLGYSAGRAGRGEDRAKAQAKAWEEGFNAGVGTMAKTFRTGRSAGAPNPYKEK